ncbi:polysaccharide biosynthesis/export family protein, partial [Candidatus Poribacteria bacterium]|nr:polysaccharide biosynthesis/export family protein [Candidatus Poribacteria bacterium]
GDRIDVTVEGYPEYSKQISVRLDGFISYPLIGEIKAEGLTIPQVEDVIRRGLADRLNSPRVFVTLLQSRQNSIYVLGMVKLAGQYPFETQQIYLLQALALAGGPDYERANLTAIQIWRDGNLHQVVDVARLIRDVNQPDIPLQPNDVIYVPSLLQQRPIMVTGAVLKPDIYEIESPHIHARQALMRAGGPEPDIADLARAEIIRSTGERIVINLENTPAPVREGSEGAGERSILKPQVEDSRLAGAASGEQSLPRSIGGLERSEGMENIAMLGPGDMLYIPNAYADEKVSIMGAVTRPGQYPIKKPVDMIEALALAGGWEQDLANLKKALIIRSNGKQESVNLFELLETGSGQSGPWLYPGDRLQVPNRLRINWSALLTVISAATLIYNIVR